MNNLLSSEFIGYLLGYGSAALWGACIVFAAAAAALTFWYRVTRRDKNSVRTPYNFSAKFFWQDTSERILITLGMILLAVRIMFVWEMKSGWYILFSIVIGLIADRLGWLLTKAGDAGADVISHKIDGVKNQLDHQDVKIDNVKEQIEEVKDKLDEKK